MIAIIHPNDLTELQQYLLASYFYHYWMKEWKAAMEAGAQFDKLYNYDNSHENIHNALNFDWDES